MIGSEVVVLSASELGAGTSPPRRLYRFNVFLAKCNRRFCRNVLLRRDIVPLFFFNDCLFFLYNFIILPFVNFILYKRNKLFIYLYKMSTSSSSSSSSSNINISIQNVSGKCESKCAYNFKYPDSSTTVTNQGVTLSFTYDSSTQAPVTYNTNPYIVSKIYMTCPSIHLFNGATTAAEIVIEHTPTLGGSTLCVAVPIISSSEVTDATALLTELIQMSSTNAPSDGDTATLNISNFTLQTIVPNKPFFTYTDSDNNDWIVFGTVTAIPLSSGTLTTLGQIIQPYALTMTGGSLFVNSLGPNLTASEGGIYISCKPTGSSEEETTVTYTNNTVTYDFFNILNSSTGKMVIQIVVGCILFIFVFLMLHLGYSYITTGSAKLPSISLSRTPPA